MSYISDDWTDERLATWAKELRDDKKLLQAVADLLDSVFSKATVDCIMFGMDKPPTAEYQVVMRFLKKLSDPELPNFFNFTPSKKAIRICGGPGCTFGPTNLGGTGVQHGPTCPNVGVDPENWK